MFEVWSPMDTTETGTPSAVPEQPLPFSPMGQAEEWRPVTAWPKIEISSSGQVRYRKTQKPLSFLAYPISSARRRVS